MAADAEKKAWQEQKKLQEEERSKAAAGALELSERRKVEHSKALAIARAEYPEHVDEDELGERGWWEEDDKEEIIEAHLAPPELLLKYRVAGDDHDSVVRLYERERVDRMERTSSAVIHQIGSVRAARERLLQHKHKVEEQTRREEEEKRLLAERLARQRVIDINEQLK